MFGTLPTQRFVGLCLLSGMLLSGCADAPHVTDLRGGMGSFSIIPYFASQNDNQAGALAAAFDEVNRFRVILTRIPSGELALDAIFEVTPGQSVYDLALQVELRSPDEQFSAVITALNGDIVLFTSPPLTVKPTIPGQPAPAPVNIPLTYSGPGVDAAVLTLSPEGYAFSPGGSATFSVEVRDQDGNFIPDVPLSWSLDAPSVASIGEGGLVQANSDGIGQVTVTTPSGLSASAWVYVVSGEFAYVRNGHVLRGPLTFQDAEDLTPDASQARTPAWSPEGETIYYEEEGLVWRVGTSTPLGEGLYPAVHPDGTKLAVQIGSNVFFMNNDGTNPTMGPSGTTPQWDNNGLSLVVAGGSIQRVRADGEERATLDLTAGVRLPSVGKFQGRIAVLQETTTPNSQGGRTHLFIMGPSGEERTRLLPVDPESELQGHSRPTLSPNEEWVLVSGGTENTTALYLMPSDGSGPPVLVANSEGVTDPAWQPDGSLLPPGSITVTGYQPAEPAPGDDIEIIGTGFDWIIPANNRVTFPAPAEGVSAADGESGSISGIILGASKTRILTRVPDRVGEGLMRVGSRTGGETAIQFTPAPGLLEVRVTKPADQGVAGAQLTLLQNGTQVATTLTNGDGQATFPSLIAGTYQLQAIPPRGFQIEGTNPQDVLVRVGQSSEAHIALRPEVFRVEIRPAGASVSVGESETFQAELLDVEGDPILDPPPIRWFNGTGHVTVTGIGGMGTVTGVYPADTEGGAEARVSVENVLHSVQISVTSSIGGTVTDDSGAGLEGIQLNLTKNGQVEGVTESGAGGVYTFSGLLGGGYTVSSVPPPNYFAQPSSASVTLGANTPVGTADFLISTQPSSGKGGGDFIVFNDLNVFDEGGMSEPDNHILVRNLFSFGGSGPRASGTVVWWDNGRSANCSGCTAASSNFASTTGIIRGEGLTIQQIYSSSGSLVNIPSNVRVIFLWMPRVYYTWQEINALKAFAQEGGRIIFNGEHGSFYSGFHVESKFFSDMGTQMTVQGAFLDCGYNTLPADRILPGQVTEGMTRYRMACSSRLYPGPNDTPLILSQEIPTAVIVAQGAIDFTPLPPPADAAPAQSAPASDEPPARRDGLVDPDGSGTVFLKEKGPGRREAIRKR